MFAQGLDGKGSTLAGVSVQKRHHGFFGEPIDSELFCSFWLLPCVGCVVSITFWGSGNVGVGVLDVDVSLIVLGDSFISAGGVELTFS